MRNKGQVAKSKIAKESGRSRRYTMAGLLEIMAKLRSPSGCPWDKEQTEQTLRKFLIEEAYEVLEAIETGTPQALKEELGDLLLQIIFLSRIAEEKGDFNFPGVVQKLAEKLIHRHPHVFPASNDHLKGRKPKNAREVVKIWGIAKKLEGKYTKRTSLLDGLPLSLPALDRSRRFSQRISRVVSDWLPTDAAWQRARKELKKLKEVSGRSPRGTAEQTLGDLLFALAIWAQSNDLSAEEALRKANRRFAKRFHRMEQAMLKREKKIGDAGPAEIRELWKVD